MTINVHDELMCPMQPGLEAEIEKEAKTVVAEFKEQIPFLAIDWFNGISDWASKKGKPVLTGSK
jgi:hypothetical protein